ncbi:putative RNA-directed DNA polymerase from transposon X-element [Trichonephila clavipes]|nr:putative RNA-directed DNA polymerase from transposon X-element [Trichonephila clavipes]
MASLNQSPGKGLMLPDLDVDKLSLHTRFLIISLPNNEISKVSPFAIQKALIGIGGEPKSVKRLRSGDLLVETNSALQTKSFLLAKHFLNSPVTINPHKTLNSCCGIISETDLLGTSDGESTLWGSAKTNPRGRQIEQVLSDHCLCLLNHEEPTYFHEPTRSFHTIDLAICSPSLLPHLNLSVEKDLYNSDHFSLLSFLTILIRVKKPSHLRILLVVQTGPFSRSWL